MQALKSILDFFTSTPKHVWQELVLDVLVIPGVVIVYRSIWKTYTDTRPLFILFSGIRKSKKEILIYLSQLSAFSPATRSKIPNANFSADYPDPQPTNRNNLSQSFYSNIDPLWSEGDGRCAADILNILGRLGRKEGYRIANTINDWNETFNPKFSIGFNPKTKDLIANCEPIDFNIPQDYGFIKLRGHHSSFTIQGKEDMGIIQKTFLKDANTPIFILAGFGVSGNILNRHAIELGKLFRNKSFCVVFKTDLSKGKDYYVMKAVYPNPTNLRKAIYFVTYFKWRKRNLFPIGDQL